MRYIDLFLAEVGGKGKNEVRIGGIDERMDRFGKRREMRAEVSQIICQMFLNWVRNDHW